MCQHSIVCPFVCVFYTSSYIEAVRGVSVMTGTNIGYFPWVSFPAKLILHIKLTFSLDVLGAVKRRCKRGHSNATNSSVITKSNVEHLY
jgi:hypothetical protein